MENKDTLEIQKAAEKYAELKTNIAQLQIQLKETENVLKDSGFDKLETSRFKITIYETAPRKTFNLERFKEDHAELNYDRPEYWKTSAVSRAIKFTEKKAGENE